MRHNKIFVMDVDIYHTLGIIECFREKVLFIKKYKVRYESLFPGN